MPSLPGATVSALKDLTGGACEGTGPSPGSALKALAGGDCSRVGLGGIVSLGESGSSLGETTWLARRLYSETTELCTDCVSKLLREPRELQRENISGVSSTCCCRLSSNVTVLASFSVSPARLRL